MLLKFSKNLHNNFQFKRLKLLGSAYKQLSKKLKDSPVVVYFNNRRRTKKSSDFKKGDSEGFVNFGLSVEADILCSVLIY